MQPSTPTIHAAHRLEFIDALRGFALLGIFGANLLIFSGYSDFMTETQQAMLPTAGSDKVAHLLERIFVENNL